MYLFPLSDSGKGPSTSMDVPSNGLLVLYLRICEIYEFDPFAEAHTLHLLRQFLTSCLQSIQQNLSLTLASVLPTPKCRPKLPSCRNCTIWSINFWRKKSAFLKTSRRRSQPPKTPSSNLKLPPWTQQNFNSAESGIKALLGPGEFLEFLEGLLSS